MSHVSSRFTPEGQKPRVFVDIDETISRYEGERRYDLASPILGNILKINKLYDEGRTKVRYPDGRHNFNPSRAVDVTPYPVNWEDRERQTLFAGFVLGTARSMGINLRWGGDWDQDFQVMDNRFDDFPHFELINKEK